jgi:hypothetical protein
VIEPGDLRGNGHLGAEVADVRRRLHAVDAEGCLHVGADCAIAIWLRTPRDVWLVDTFITEVRRTPRPQFSGADRRAGEG